MIILEYIGNGNYIPGIPDHDLDEADVEASGMTVQELVKTGLWKKATHKAENKAKLDKYPNKESG